MTVLAAGVNTLALVVFAAVLTVTLVVTYWASKRTNTATEFWAAGRGISGVQNGFAVAGDYMSAASFLGFAGLIYFFGLDGFVGLVCALVAFLPALLLALFWPRFNTMGAICGVVGSLIVSLVLIILSPAVWPGPDAQGSPIPLENPALVTFPLGFLFCWLGTVLSSEGTTERSYHELHVRAETGLGAEGSG